MNLGKYYKAPDERKRYSIDYSDWLDTAERLSSVTFQVTPIDRIPCRYRWNSSIQTGGTKALGAACVGWARRAVVQSYRDYDNERRTGVERRWKTYPLLR